MRPLAGPRRRALAAAVSALAAVALAVAVAGRGCRAEDDSPLAAAQAFVAAARAGDREALYGLLAPATQKRLDAAARRASELVGGSSRYAPADLIQVGAPRQGPTRARFVLSGRRGDRATVEVIEPGGARSSLALVDVDGRWRVELPGYAPPRS